MRGLVCSIVSLLLLTAAAMAVEPDEVLPDPDLEARARAITQELRCLVCQNQSIDDSNAPLARDLRLIVRERLMAGDTDEAVIAYVTARYGDYVLLRPPFKPGTLFLWLGPLLVLMGAAFLAVAANKKRRYIDAAPLTADEGRALQSALKTLDDGA